MPVRSFVCVENSTICLFLTRRELSGKRNDWTFWVCIASVCIPSSNCSKWWSGYNANSHFSACPCCIFPSGVEVGSWVKEVPPCLVFIGRSQHSSFRLHLLFYLDWLSNPWKGLVLLDAKQHHGNCTTGLPRLNTGCSEIFSQNWSCSAGSEYTIISSCDRVTCWQLNQHYSTETSSTTSDEWLVFKWLTNDRAKVRYSQALMLHQFVLFSRRKSKLLNTTWKLFILNLKIKTA